MKISLCGVNFSAVEEGPGPGEYGCGDLDKHSTLDSSSPPFRSCHTLDSLYPSSFEGVYILRLSLISQYSPPSYSDSFRNVNYNED